MHNNQQPARPTTEEWDVGGRDDSKAIDKTNAPPSSTEHELAIQNKNLNISEGDKSSVRWMVKNKCWAIPFNCAFVVKTIEDFMP